MTLLAEVSPFFFIKLTCQIVSVCSRPFRVRFCRRSQSLVSSVERTRVKCCACVCVIFSFHRVMVPPCKRVGTVQCVYLPNVMRRTYSCRPSRVRFSPIVPCLHQSAYQVDNLYRCFYHVFLISFIHTILSN